MNSMKRTAWPGAAEPARDLQGGLVQPAAATPTFTGRPGAGGRVDPGERATGKSTSFIARKTSSSRESRLTVTRLRPACASASALDARSARSS